MKENGGDAAHTLIKLKRPGGPNNGPSRSSFVFRELRIAFDYYRGVPVDGSPPG